MEETTEDPSLVEAFIASKKALKARQTEIDQAIAALQKERKDIKVILRGAARGARVAAATAEKKKPRRRGPKPGPAAAASA